MMQRKIESQDCSMEAETVRVWLRHYEEDRADFSDLSSIPKLSKYREVLYDKLAEEVERLKTLKEPIRIWSAGSGYDFVSLKLKQVYGEIVDLTILDVSPQCIESNKQMFAKFGLNASFVVGNLFDSDYKQEFDIVTNTGLLEHFSQTEQRELVRRFSQSLIPGGHYLTLVPNAGARIYNLWMNRSKMAGTWKYGPENPLSDLKSLESDEMLLVEEFPVGATHQLKLIPNILPMAGLILNPVVLLADMLDQVVDPILMKAIGGYCLFGKFEKAKGV